MISPPSEGVRNTRQKTALSISGFSIISSFRESLKFCKCVGKAFVNAVAYRLVNSALCLLSVLYRKRLDTSVDIVVHQEKVNSTHPHSPKYTVQTYQSTMNLRPTGNGRREDRGEPCGVVHGDNFVLGILFFRLRFAR